MNKLTDTLTQLDNVSFDLEIGAIIAEQRSRDVVMAAATLLTELIVKNELT